MSIGNNRIKVSQKELQSIIRKMVQGKCVCCGREVMIQVINRDRLDKWVVV